MTIYVVTSGSYSDYSIDGVFSSEELAARYIAQFLPPDKDRRIEEWQVDEHAEDVRQTYWTAVLNLADGNVPPSYSQHSRDLAAPRTTVEKPFRADTEISQPWWRGAPDLITGRSTVSYEHALKVAAEGRQAWLRERETKEMIVNAEHHL